MEKQEYLEKLEALKESAKRIEDLKKELRNDYIESNKPCSIDDIVQIKTTSGRIIKGAVKSFMILNNEVIISSVKPEKGSFIHISMVYESVEVLK